MAKLIFRCNYIKGSTKRHKDNFMRYIATRENVEKVITVEKLKDKKEKYIDYLANRPRVVKVGTHGLFTNEGEELELNKVAEEVANHKGTIWTNVISIKREDAERLGYDSLQEWQSLVRSKVGLFSEMFKIKLENLKWYAAFHNESHHPHIHLVIYSKDENEGFIGKKGIEKLRATFAHDIFRQDFANIYDEQTKARDDLKKESYVQIKNIINEIKNKILDNPELEKDILLLADKLKNTKGKKVYGYLKPEVKDIVNQIIDKIAKDEKIDKLYSKWYESRDEILKIYRDTLPAKVPLFELKEFKSIKNCVIEEALKLVNGEIPILKDLDDFLPTGEIQDTEEKDITSWNPIYDRAVKMLREDQKSQEAVKILLEEAERGNALAMYDLGRIYTLGKATEKDEEKSYQWYSKSLNAFLEMKGEMAHYMKYRVGKLYVNGLGTDKDYLEGLKWLEQCKEKHIYAKYLIGVMYQRGLGVEENIEKAIEIYKSVSESIPYAAYEVAKYIEKQTPENLKEIQMYYTYAFIGFETINEKIQEEDKQKNNIEYKLGRMAYYGLGTEKNIPKAIGYLESSSKAKNQYAQCLLGLIYLTEKEVRDETKSLEWLNQSAEQGNEFAKVLIKSIEERRNACVMLSVNNLFFNVVQTFEQNNRNHYFSEKNRMRLSKKRRKELARKHKKVSEYEESLTI